MSELCTDNRFELIEKYKAALIEATNIETAQDEMAVIDDILFRFWQMGWLDKLDADAVPVVRCKDCRYSYTEALKISSQQGHLETRNIRFCKCELPTIRAVADMHFCSCGERKNDDKR